MSDARVCSYIGKKYISSEENKLTTAIEYRIFLDGRKIQDIFLPSTMIIGYICNLFAERCIRFHAGFFRKKKRRSLNIISRSLVLLLSTEKLFQLSIFSLRRIDTHFKMTRRKMFKHTER